MNSYKTVTEVKVIIMKNIMKRLLTTLVIFALVFTCFPAFTGSLEADAASKPGIVKKIHLKTVETSQINVSWSEVKKVDGYTVFRNGKAIKHVKKGVTSFADKGLKSDTKYTYYVKAYKNVKQKQWYNKKTKKWQKKKPAKKYRGKSKKVKVKVYGKSSAVKSIKTGKVIIKGEEASYEGPSMTYSYNTNTIKVTMFSGEKDSKVTITSKDLPKVVLDEDEESYTYKNLKPGTKYVFNIEQYYGGQVRNKFERTITTEQEFKFAATPRKDCIELSWTEMKNAEEYKVIRKCGNKRDEIVVKATECGYIDKVDRSKEYVYQVQVKRNGEWKGSKQITVGALTKK